MLRGLLAGILSFILVFPSSGQESKIRGKGSYFAGDSITFFTYREPLFNLQYSVGQVQADNNGDFHFTLHSSTTECVHSRFGPYDGYFYVEPGYDYLLQLPELENMGDEWHLAPSFRRIAYHLEAKVIDKKNNEGITEINKAIRAFDNEFYPFKDKQLIRYYSPNYSQAKLDSFKKANPVLRNVSDNAYYRRYRYYSIGLLEFSVNVFNTDSLADKYFKDQPVSFGLRPYRDLFNLIFDDYFLHLSKKDHYTAIFRYFTDSSYTTLKNYLQADPVLANDTIFETVLLKEIYDSYYSDDFSRSSLTALVDSIRKNTVISISRDMANEALRRFNQLQPGSPAPSFHLKGIDGKEYTLKDFRGSYVCLGFCSISSLTCLREFEYLKQIAVRHAAYLKVVTIIPSSDPEGVKRFVEQNGIHWPVLVTSDPGRLYSEYKVKAFPSFYLIDKQGKIVRAPVPNPSEGFEQVLFKVMKKRGEI